MRWMVMVVALAGCAPEAADLYGLWVTVDEGEVRGLEMGAYEGPVEGPIHGYKFYRYAEGEDSAEVQRGSYDVLEGDGPELVTTVEWDIDGSLIGQDFGNPIRGHSGKKLKLEVDETTGATRTYRAEDALP